MKVLGSLWNKQGGKDECKLSILVFAFFYLAGVTEVDIFRFVSCYCFTDT